MCESDLGPQSSHYVHNENFKEGHGQLYNMVQIYMNPHTCVHAYTHMGFGCFFFFFTLGFTFSSAKQIFLKRASEEISAFTIFFFFLRLD